MNIKNYSTKFFGKNDTLSAYLAEVRKYSVPTQEEEEILVERMKNGDKKAKDELILRNQRFIYSLAKIYAKSEDDVLEYVNEGNIGFSIGLDRFEGGHGTRVISFCVWYIRRSMHYFLVNTSNIVVRTNAMKLGKKVDAVKDEYYQTFGVYPTETEIVELLKDKYNISVNDQRDIYDVNVTSISDEVDDDLTVENNSEYSIKTASVNTYENTIEDDYKRQMVDEVMEVIEGKEREKEIIMRLYGIGYDRAYTAAEIGEMFDMYEEDVISFKKKILEYIRTNYKMKVAV